ncbi:uncharacterized protein F4812DRAFT_460454 [Daldinia caldariorum]|uniref:uncharacterized protein n=1 Tax=Daldinia caldariorum TaxID=326644 RepID=UPI00200828C8|nr:uncharacterized protein F4812DRAFT_460454 [Daldinia caldariorum]KAI1466897.1 hypothetical protein F4812DRAFT_460454 [Daldinia caldariorum]
MASAGDARLPDSAPNQNHGEPGSRLRALAPAPIPVPVLEEFSAIEEMVSRHTQYLVDYCQGLMRTYHETGDATWLEKHRLIRQHCLTRFDAFGLHYTQCRKAFETTLEPPHVNVPNNALQITQNGEASKTPQVPVARAQTVEVIPRPYTPHQIKGESVPPSLSVLEKRISMSWHRQHKLRFTLSYAGTSNYLAPRWHFAYKYHGEWQVDGWRLPAEGVRTKTYVVLDTSRNAGIVHEAHNYLAAHKAALIYQLAESKSQSLEDYEPDI